MKRYEKSRYFKMFFDTLIVYGYEDDSEFEEDYQVLDHATSNGYIFGKWFSEACIYGEYGSNRIENLVLISREEFEEAKLRGWCIMDQITKDEFEELRKIFESNEFYIARMISGLKSLYRSKYPTNEVYFNANIFVDGIGKVWYGDIDLTLDGEKLQKVADQIKKPFFILSEMSGRFEFKNREDYKEVAKASFYPKE